jgi:predicted dehydrogenase
MQHLTPTRRRFLQSSTAAALTLSALPAATYARIPGANQKLGIGIIGVGGQGGFSLHSLAPLENIVVLCDVDSKRVEKERAAHKNAAFTQDFREVVERKDIDAVAVCTPDHTHAPIAMAALKANKHVYCEKPLCHTVYEVLALMNEARRRKLVTQMGTQIHAGENYRRVVEIIQSGILGPIQEVHTWVGVSYAAKDFPADTPPIPEGLNYDLWLGPAAYQPYHKDFLPFWWRKYWKFGTGAFGDMACHHMDLPKWALGLGMPISIEAEGSPLHANGCPEWVIARYLFPRAEGGEPLPVTWYDGGKRPPQFAAGKLPEWGNGNLFVGAKGMLLADYGRYQLLPKAEFKEFKPTPKIPKSIGHHKEWCEAIKGNGQPLCRFDYSGPLSLAVLLGTVAYRSGQKLEWDHDKNWVGNSTPKVEALLKKEYRQGWSL